MIEPFEESLCPSGWRERPVISYGLSSYGYDLRVADEFKVFTNVYSAVVDPKAFDRSLIRGYAWRVVPRAAELLCARPQR